MAKLSTVMVDNLHEVLERVSIGKAAKRVMIALASKDGVFVETLSAVRYPAIDGVLLTQPLLEAVDRRGY